MGRPPLLQQQGRPRSRWLRPWGGTEQLVEWVNPVRPPVHPLAGRTPELCAALPAVLGGRARRSRVAPAGCRPPTVPLGTTCLALDLSPADAVADLSQVRWQVESNLRHLKPTLGWVALA